MLYVVVKMQAPHCFYSRYQACIAEKESKSFGKMRFSAVYAEAA